MDTVVSFDILWKDVLAHSVTMSQKSISVVNHTPDIAAIQFRVEPSREDMLNFLRSRCFPSERFDRDKILAALGLEYHNIWDLLRIKHGVMWDDFVWIRFHGEDLTWNDVRIR